MNANEIIKSIEAEQLKAEVRSSGCRAIGKGLR